MIGSVRKIAVRFSACALAALLAFSMALPYGSNASIAWAEEGNSEQGIRENANAAQEDQSQSEQEAARISGQIADLSEYYLTNDGLMTPVRLQNPWGSCWAFAIAAALESSILKAQAKLESVPVHALAAPQDASDYSEPQLTGLNTDIDISERAIGWFAHELQTEASAGPQAGEGNQRTNADDPSSQMAGGSFSTVEAMLTSRQAIVAETSAPYEYNGYSAGSFPWYALPSGGAGDARNMDWSLPDSVRTSNDVGWEIREVLHLASPALSQFAGGESYTYQGYDADATRQIKETLANVGAVAIALSTDVSLPQEVLAGRSAQAEPSEHLTYSTWSQYNSENNLTADHAVTIVGWDDSYSASNFAGTASGQPPADGAWLCKNDWGSDYLFAELGASGDSLKWGIRAEDGSATGFFWLSYYDHTISAPTAFVVQPAEAGYDNLYQHDYLSNSEFYVPTSYNQDLWVANVFTAEDTELLEAVSAQTFSAGDTVKIRICTLPAGRESYSSDGADSTDAADGSTNATDADEISGDNANVPDESSLLDDANIIYEAEATFDIAGFHTIELEQPILIAKGQRFAIMESIVSGTNPDSRYLNLELAFTTDPVSAGMDTFAKVVANAGETYVDLSGQAWVSLEDFNTWYADYCAENNLALEMIYGNALIKAYSNKTAMSEGSGQTYGLIKLGEWPDPAMFA